MKTSVNLLLAIALLATACTTGSKVTSGGYTDDVYFTPGDARPVAPRPVKEAKKPVAQKKSVVAMQVEENEQGKVVNNYIVPKTSRKDNNAYYFDEQPAYADTVMEYKNDKEEITINNYFQGEEMDYSSRIRAFYNPYFYNPFWDPFWDPYYGSFYGSYGFGRSWGWGGFGWGGYSPYMGWGGYYDPWYSGFGWGGYGGYGGYGGWGGYYSGYGWGGGYGYYAGYGGGKWNDGNHYRGKQNYTGGGGGSNAVRYGMNTNKNGSLGGSLSGQSGFRNLSGSTRYPAGGGVNATVSGARVGVTGSGATSTRLSGTRDNTGATVLPQNQTNNTQSFRVGRGETVTNLRRSNNNPVQGSGAAVQSGTYSRPATSGSGYTPTYSRPRMNTQSSYNSGSTRQYSPQSTNSSSQSGRYSRPQSSGSSTVRTQSSSGSYQRGSVTSTPNVSSGRSNSSGGSYAPTRSGESNSSSRSYAPSSSSSNSGGSFGGSRSGSSGSSGSGNTGTGSSGGGGGRRQ
jgi:hypothetical protein